MVYSTDTIMVLKNSNGETATVSFAERVTEELKNKFVPYIVKASGSSFIEKVSNASKQYNKEHIVMGCDASRVVHDLKSYPVNI